MTMTLSHGSMNLSRFAMLVIVGAVALSFVEGATGAIMDADAPGRTQLVGSVLGASAAETIRCVNYNGGYLSWTVAAPSLYFYGAGIGGSNADSIPSSLLSSAGSWEDYFYDCDSIIVKAGAGGCTYVGAVKDW